MESKYFILIATVFFLAITAADTRADDLLITGGINGVQNYDSTEGIVFDEAILTTTADVTAQAAYEVTLMPGTSIAAGARLTVIMKDNDGLNNRWEMQFFGDLSHNPEDDSDGDRLSNLQECLLGFDPTIYDLDNDDDGLPDWWEISYLGGDLSVDNDILNPGGFYIYDARGRITHFINVQSR